MSYKAGFLIVMALILSLGGACGGTGSGESLGLVPQGAEMVGHIGVGELLGNSDLIALYDALPKDADGPQTVDAALGDFREETGIDLRSFDELLIFGDLATGLDEVEYAGVIGTGVFDTARFLSDIEDAADIDFTQTTRGEYEISADVEADVAVAFLDEGTVVMGTVDAVTDVVDVKAGDAPAIGGDVSDMFGGLGNVLAKLAATSLAFVFLISSSLLRLRCTSPSSVLWSSLEPEPLSTTGNPSLRAAATVSFSLDVSISLTTGMPKFSKNNFAFLSDSAWRPVFIPCSIIVLASTCTLLYWLLFIRKKPFHAAA